MLTFEERWKCNCIRPALTIRALHFPHCILLCSVWWSQKIPIISANSFTQLVLIIDMSCVLCELRNKTLRGPVN